MLSGVSNEFYIRLSDFLAKKNFLQHPVVVAFQAQKLAHPSPSAWQQWLIEQAHSYETAIDFSTAQLLYLQFLHDFPDMPQGYEGFVGLSQLLQQWEDSIAVARLYQENFPERIQSYRWLSQMYQTLANYPEAEKQLVLLIEKFPNERQAYLDLADRLQRRFAYREALNYWDKWLTIFGSEGEASQILYGKALIAMSLLPKAQHFFQSMLTNHPDSRFGWHGLGLVQYAMGDTQTARASLEQALRLSQDTPDYCIQIVTSADFIFEKSVYEAHMADLIAQFPHDAFLRFHWANMPLLAQPFAKTNFLQKQRYETLLDLFPDNALLLSMYGTILLHCDLLIEADSLFSELVEKYPTNIDIFKGYCISAHHRQDWQGAYTRFCDFYVRFPHDPTEFFFYFANTLYHLQRFSELRDAYHRFNLVRFHPPILTSPTPHAMPYAIEVSRAITELQVSLMLGDYMAADNAFDAIQTARRQSMTTHVTLPFYAEIVSKVIINDPANEVLFVVFQGAIAPAAGYYSFYGFEQLDNVVFFQRNYQSFDMEGFAKKSPHYNFLLLRDAYNSPYLSNRDNYLALIQAIFDTLKAKYLVCFGISGGGHASLSYGQDLKADLVFSMMPRCQIFLTQSEQYYHDLQHLGNLTQPEIVDVGYLQHKTGGFIPKTYITLCENYAIDAISLHALDASDSNLNITYCHSDIHGIMHYLGTKNVFLEITRITELYRQADFDLPIQADIFSQLAGFKYNSKAK